MSKCSCYASQQQFQSSIISIRGNPIQQPSFIVQKFAVKFFFNISANIIPNSIICFQKVTIFTQKIHPFSMTITTFYISAPLLHKHYMQWLNFKIIIQVSNKVLLVFLTKRNFVTYYLLCYQYLHILKKVLLQH